MGKHPNTAFLKQKTSNLNAGNDNKLIPNTDILNDKIKCKTKRYLCLGKKKKKLSVSCIKLLMKRGLMSKFYSIFF